MTLRASGLLLHVTSLAGEYGIGDLGPAAYRFADFLSAAGQRIWQMLPLNPVDPGGSPYSSASAFAGNPLLISPYFLIRSGLLTHEEARPQKPFSEKGIDYPAVAAHRQALLSKAFDRMEQQGKTPAGFHRFCVRHRAWLDDFAIFMALKQEFHQQSWNQWPRDLRDRHPDALAQVQETLARRIRRHQFGQFVFFHQWQALKNHCHARSIRLYGDLPIYQPFDSADVWSRPDQYQLDENRSPIRISGVPPDYFSETGQLWGHPVYDWPAMQKDRYRWWVRRFAHNLEMFDVVRIDHFRGMVAYWEVPASAKTAENGRWVSVPSDDFFTTLSMRFGRLPVIAEDLGTITPDVRECMHRFELPGMRVLQFAFGNDFPRSSFLPHHHEKHGVVYTGTHDNNTLRGWFEEELDSRSMDHLRQYLGTPVSADTIHEQMIRLAMMSVADTVILPVQDILGLPASARLNQPAGAGANWQWRLSGDSLTRTHAGWLRTVTATYGRCRESSA